MDYWQSASSEISRSEFSNHYIIDLPLLSEAVYINILCIFINNLIHGNHISTDDITWGADGVIATFNETNDSTLPKCRIRIDGVPAAPGRIRVLVAPEKNIDIYALEDDFLEHMTTISDYAFKSLFSAIGDNLPLIHNMRAYLVLPNYNLDVPDDSMEWRIPLRDICFCNRMGKPSLEFRDWMLPMETLYKLVPLSYIDEFNEYIVST
jgi:hypothetical protein